MILDPYVTVMCDTEDEHGNDVCDSNVDIYCEYKYTTCSGNHGYYDFSDKAIEEGIKKEGWTVKDNKHYCPECVNMKPRQRS